MKISILWFSGTLEVDAEIIGQVGIHKKLYPNKLEYPRTYSVVHVASGYNLCEALEYEQAVELANKLKAIGFDFDKYARRGYDTTMEGYKAAKNLVNHYRGMKFK